MKHLKIIAIVTVLALISVDSFGYSRHRGTRHRNHWSNTQSHDTGAVGAPLDGGLLTILGAAGVAYYVSRRKKKGSV